MKKILNIFFAFCISFVLADAKSDHMNLQAATYTAPKTYTYTYTYTYSKPAYTYYVAPSYYVTPS